MTPERREALLDGCVVLEPRAVYDPCLVGVVERVGYRFALYSKAKVLRALERQFEYEADDPVDAAREWFVNNTNGGWHGERTFAFLMDDEPEEADEA